MFSFISGTDLRKLTSLLVVITRRTLHNSSRLSHEISTLREESFNKLYNVPAYIDLDACKAWGSRDDQITAIRTGLLAGMQILPDYVTQDEEKSLISEIEPYLKRMRYEFDHWDNAIHGFRETERSAWTESNTGVLKRAQETAISSPDVPLPHTHVLDLDAKGYIKPHVDSVRFCGSTVAGLCLLSSAVMRLRHSNHSELFADFHLSHRCLYIMKDLARYDFSHEVLKDDLSFFRGQTVPRSRRISLMCRSKVLTN